jgi:hypothetical protein
MTALPDMYRPTSPTWLWKPWILRWMIAPIRTAIELIS